MLVYTLLFTLVGESPETNPYIPMFAKWFAYLIHYAQLSEFDIVLILIDDITKEYLEKDHKLNEMIEALPFNFHYYRIPQPFSKIEGLCEKYTCEPSVFSSFETNLYVDLNYLITGSLKPFTIPLKKKNTLLVKEEKIPGITPSIFAFAFAFVVSPEIMRFFDGVVKGCLCLATNICRSDQSFFNTFVYKIYAGVYELDLDIQIIDDQRIFTRGQHPRLEE